MRATDVLFELVGRPPSSRARDVGAGAAHVEGDDVLDPRCLCGGDGSGDTAGWSAQQAVFRMETVSLLKTSGAGHEKRRGVGKWGRNVSHKLRENGGEVGIDDGGACAR